MLRVFLIVFGIVFLLLFLIFYFILIKPRLKFIFTTPTKAKQPKIKKQKKKVEVGELNYLIVKFKLDKSKLNWQSLALVISILNSFIIAFVVALLELIKVKLMFKLIIAFGLLISLIYALYEIYGRILQKKQMKEDRFNE